MSAEHKTFWQDESGAAFLEFTAGVLTFFTILFGIIEFSYAFYQWNAATKAMQVGARLAAVSEPVVTGFRDITGLSNSILPGDRMPAFDYTCSAGETGCDDNALRLIVFGRCDTGEACTAATINGRSIPVRTACNPRSTPANIGMCNVFPRVDSIDKVVVRYSGDDGSGLAGLGYAGRPGGPVPTITVSLQNLDFDFILLSAFLRRNSIAMPSFATTVTGEDLNAGSS